MNIDFDPAKNVSNTLKHGVSLDYAECLEWSDALIWTDTRRDYGEPRKIALASDKCRLYCVVFVEREDVKRIISLRKANQREFNHYETQFDSPN